MEVGFFVDNGLGPNVVRGLRELGYTNVEHLQETFPEDCPDEEWLAYCGQKGLCLITRDRNIRKRPNEKAALLEYNIVGFYLLGKEMSARMLTRQIINSWEKWKPKHAYGKRRDYQQHSMYLKTLES